MKAAIIVLTSQGLDTAYRIIEKWKSEEQPELWAHERALHRAEMSPLDRISFAHIKDILPDLWQRCTPLVFIMATGIVVRQIAPYLQGKDRDPAVLVLDEKGEYVISLLSGHLGGANAWARTIGNWLNARPVITTATDVQGMTAPDEYARQFGWTVEPVAGLRKVNSFLLEQGYLNVWSDCLPEAHPVRLDASYHFLAEKDKARAHIWITMQEHKEPDPLFIIPQIYSVGVGCRKDMDAEHIKKAIIESIQQLNISIASVKGIYSIDLKSEEAGIIEAAYSFGLPFRTFAAEEIQQINEKQGLVLSDYVKEKIGVNGVCEAASLLGTNQGELVLPKQKYSGVTVAISKEKSL